MEILLAPMEGVIDGSMRALLTRVGGYHRCVTEFVRVTDREHPAKLFYRLSPELKNGGLTASGVPVYIQLLGGDSEVMAANAARAVSLGAPGIDLNFGCPSPIVNRKAGGAILLKEPERIHAIVAAVRRAVAGRVPVTAKLRLGYDDTEMTLDIVRATEAAGVDQIVVHARTRRDGYRVPARWEWLARINEVVTRPVVANGDIRSIGDYQRCLAESGCQDVMIGRAALYRPDLARGIGLFRANKVAPVMGWPELSVLIAEWGDAMLVAAPEKAVVARLKQWLRMLFHHYPEVEPCFSELRTETDWPVMRRRLLRGAL